MNTSRKVEVFSAGCALCGDAIDLIKKLACPSCVVEILDMNNDDVNARAKNLGIKAVPAVVIDGRLVDCCRQSGIDPARLIAAGLGKPIA